MFLSLALAIVFSAAAGKRWQTWTVVGACTWRRNHEWATARGGESVLRERYARGEIDESEYRERLQVLRGEGQ
ncbi:SHOCT domain-containing protein [Arthrobacter sp. NPDC093139]|uniref:SHOCT domain-containing protein n=1 Tax=Arthrobacter sp. NPDC093139 TaxID=3363945 RepID=UPI003814A2A5